MNSKKMHLPPASDETKIHPVLKEYFGYCLYKAALKYKSMFAKELEKYKMTGPQVAILKILQATGPLSQIALGHELQIDKASMVKFIDGLEKNKMVQRIPSKEDRRIKLVEVTSKGLQIFGSISKARQEAEDIFLNPLSAQEKKMLRQAVAKLI